jgi:predicted DNA binding CopG/RHH family protein
VQTSQQVAKEQRAEAALEQSLVDEIDNAEIVTKAVNSTAPISIRLSAPLLERVDRLAAADGRTRSNLIQRILWEYVHSHEK